MPQMLATPSDQREQITSLYRQAHELEYALWSATQGNPFAEMTPEQTQAYNGILQRAREIVPELNALRGTVREIGDDALVSEVHYALRTGLVPALQETLPPALASHPE